MHNKFVSSPEELAAFTRQCAQHDLNAYYSVNRAKTKLPVKLKAEQVTHVDYLHLDYDLRNYPPNCDDPASHARKVMRAALKGLKKQLPPPTFVVFSGGGLNILWRLRKPLVNADPLHVAGYNKALADSIHGADPVHDVSRILRLPGTLNIPGSEKRARGRIPVTAEWWEHEPGNLLDLATCRHSPVAPKPEQELPALGPLRIVDDVRSIIPEEHRNTHQAERLVLLAEFGYLPYSPKKGGDVVHVDEHGEEYVTAPDRSRWDFDFACNALRLGISHKDIASYLLTPGGAGEHCREQPDVLRAVQRCIGNAGARVNKFRR